MKTIDETIAALMTLKNKVGGDQNVVLMTCDGEHDSFEIDYPIVGEFTDGSGNDFKCALVGSIYSDEFTERGTAHYKWHPSKNKVEVEVQPPRFDGYVRVDCADCNIQEPKIIDCSGVNITIAGEFDGTAKEEKESSSILHVKFGVRYFEDAVVDGEQEDDSNPTIPGVTARKFIKWEIDVGTGRILNWRSGTTAKVWYKVCDEFEYDYAGYSYGPGYVPDFMALNSAGWGDYIRLSIDADGIIQNWNRDRFEAEHKGLMEANRNRD